MTRVITVTNQKGGTGKTTLVAILAAGLARRGRSVLMIDLDPQAHLSSFFISPERLEEIPGSFDLVLAENYEIVRVASRVWLVPSCLRYIVAAYRGEIPVSYPFALDAQVLQDARLRRFDYIICDTPPEIYPPTIWALFAADYLIIPANLEELSLVGTRLLIREVLPDIFVHSRRNLRVLGVVLTNITRHWSPETIARISEGLRRFILRHAGNLRHRFFREPFFRTIIHRHPELRDLVYRPRRRATPLLRIIENNEELRRTALSLASEVEERIARFEPL